MLGQHHGLNGQLALHRVDLLVKGPGSDFAIIHFQHMEAWIVQTRWTCTNLKLVHQLHVQRPQLVPDSWMPGLNGATVNWQEMDPQGTKLEPGIVRLAIAAMTGRRSRLALILLQQRLVCSIVRKICDTLNIYHFI